MAADTAADTAAAAPAAAPFAMPKVAVNATGWGPTDVPAKFAHVPYAPFNKNDRLGRIADITGVTKNWRYRNYDRGTGESNADLAYRHDLTEDADFQLVDTSKDPRKPDYRRHMFSRRRAAPRPEPLDKAKKSGRHQSGQSSFNRRYDRLTKARYQSRRRVNYRNKVTRESSVKVEAEWEVLDQIEFAQMQKMTTTVPKPEDLKWAGMLDEYDDGFDRISTKSQVPLHRFSDREFFFVSSRYDPILNDMAAEKVGNVFITDTIMAHIMTGARTVYPWDVVVTYASGLIFIDVRDGVEFGLHSVYETAFEPPPEDDPEDINGKRKLSQEATSIYQNFTQACLRKNSKSRLAKASGGAGGGAGAGAGAGSSGSTGPGGVAIEAHPFFSAEDSNYKAPASICYRYRKWQLDADTTIVCRHSLNAVSRKKGKEQLLSVFALNEFDLKATDWRKKCDAQRGAVMATELKNNGAKIASWTAQAILVGANAMKIGYVSRKHHKDSHNHFILGTQNQKPKDFAFQVNLDQKNMWGILKHIIDRVRMHAEKLRGDTPAEEFACKFLVVKDPNRPLLRIHSILDMSTFENDEEDGDWTEEEGEEGEEED